MDENKLLIRDYEEILILVAGRAATLLIMSVFAMKVVLVENLDKRTCDLNLIFFCAFAFYTCEAGFTFLAILLPLLVYPSYHSGAYIIGRHRSSVGNNNWSP